MPVTKPLDGDPSILDLLESPLETADDARWVEIGRRQAAIEDADMRRRREQVLRELAVRRIRRQKRCTGGNEHDADEQRAARRLHAAWPSRTRGSAANSSRSAMRLPSARKTP